MSDSTQKSKWNPRNWKLGEYTRQLSIVVLGIVITFLGSAAIGSIKEHKEVRTALRLVVSELQENKNTLNEVINRIQLEKDAACFLYRHKDNLASAPADTLNEYFIVPFQLTLERLTNDALELMKTSGIFPKLDDEKLGLQIIKTYNEMQLAIDSYSYFNKTKEEGIKIISANLENKLILFDSDSPVVIWNTVLKDPMGEVMLKQTMAIYQSEYIEAAILIIDETIKEIENY